ncbi:hypothetical protein [Bacillus sp. FJAT-42315]|uniref:hypothetical protein n=1 Tax=Bacillus sp. FJAT-42315 TaxID=2014077 RepID=UPI000C249F56|nr:hypothetical protein [Bacillus sp. FJAT-42315]
MAFGITKKDVLEWKRAINRGELAFLTHYWLDDRFPCCKTVTKVGCRNMNQLAEWGKQYGLSKEWIDDRKMNYPHYDLLGERQKTILEKEGLIDHITKFQL